jgi:membrane protease YdiL (CAAX protease family)
MSDDQPILNDSVSAPSGLAKWPPVPLAARAGILLGPEGLRAGWRLLVFAVLLVGGLFASGPLLRLAHFSPRSFRDDIALSSAMLFGSALIASGIMSCLEKYSWTDYGLPLRGPWFARFCEGIVWGLLALSLLLLLLRLHGNFDYGVAAFPGAAMIRNAVLWGVAFLLVGLAEEYTFRGYPLFTLTRGMGFWPAAVVLSVLFGAAHLNNPGESWLGAVMAGLIGLFFCLTLRRTGSLWFAIGAHTAWDWAETFLYGVPDSGQVAPGHLFNPSFHGSRWLTGGSVGPEGSLLALAVVALLFVAFHFRFRPGFTTELPARSGQVHGAGNCSENHFHHGGTETRRDTEFR